MKTPTRKPKKLLALLLSMIMALSMSITAFAEDTDDDAELTNYIYSLDRLVKQDGETLLHGVTDWTVTEDGTGGKVTYEDIDIFPVDEGNLEGITVTYDATMNMEYLSLDNRYFDLALNYYKYDSAWELLQAWYGYIDDATEIHLVFDMDEDVLLSEVDTEKLASQIELVSDMFTFNGNAEDLEIDKADNTLTITCYWDSEKAATNYSDGLDPMIYLYNVELPITDDWSNDDDEEETNYLTIINHGSVDGIMFAYGVPVTIFNETSEYDLENITWAIDGGSENDVFVLTTDNSVKISAPGITKKIWVDTDNDDEIDDGELVDADSVDAGTVVSFYLKSNIPQTLLSGTYIWSDGEDDESEGESEGESSNGTSTTSLDDDLAVVDAVVDETATYVITFHDVLDSNFTLNTSSFEVTIGDTTIDSSNYTISYSTSDGCTFEISIDLIQLYLAGIIGDDDIAECAEIVVTYTATLAADAEPGCYNNDAWVTYPDGESEDDEVDVYTYGIDVYKYGTEETESTDDDGNTTTTTSEYALEGAGFILYKYEAQTGLTTFTSGTTYYTYELVYTYTEVDMTTTTTPEGGVTYYTATTDDNGNVTGYTVCGDLGYFDDETTYYTASSAYEYVEVNTATTESDGDTINPNSSETYYVILYYKETTETSTDDEGDETTTVTGVEWVSDLYDDEEEYNATVLYSDSNGEISFVSLEAGTYYLLEVVTPDGYVSSSSAIEITVPGDTETSYSVKASVENSKVPETGGMGTDLIYLAGLALVLLAGGAVLVSMKRRNAEVG